MQITTIIADWFAKLRDQGQFSFTGRWAITNIGMPRKMTGIRRIVAGNLRALRKFSEIKIEPISI
ncbi:hypothetical protein [Sulfitobacter sp. MF3-043]|uniref:hypothetical protein n=1 Tax=Sulfitobacter sediminivivens TaxID=3252902 RepID=UPI003EBB849B